MGFNKWIGMGRLTNDVDLKYSSTDSSMAIAKYSLAVPRKGKKEEVDFIRCTAFGKAAEFASKYFKKGLRVLVEGHLQIGSYTNKDNIKIPTADVIIESQEFADGKSEPQQNVTNGFVDVANDTDSEIPFT